MQSHLCNVMQKLHGATFTVSPVGQAESKSGAGPGSGATQDGEPEAVLPVGSQRQSSPFRELRLREARQVQDLGSAARGGMAQQDGGCLHKRSLARLRAGDH